MFRLPCLLVVALFVFAAPAVHADQGWYPIKADDGSGIPNHRMPLQLKESIEKLPAITVLGNAHGKVTLYEFYDLNCPYCRAAAGDIDTLLRNAPELRLVLVPFPVLGIPSIEAGKVELAVRKLATPQQFYQFYRKAMATRGVMDGTRALAIAKALGFDAKKVLTIANEDALTNTMIAHVRLGNALAIAATPGFAIADDVILGYPGPKSMAHVVDAVARCGKPVCGN